MSGAVSIAVRSLFSWTSLSRTKEWARSVWKGLDVLKQMGEKNDVIEYWRVCVCVWWASWLGFKKRLSWEMALGWASRRWTGSSGGENHRHAGLETSLIWSRHSWGQWVCRRGGGGWQRHEAESRPGRDWEAEVSSLDFVSSAVGSLEWRQDLVDLHFSQGFLCGGWVIGGEEERWWNYLQVYLLWRFTRVWEQSVFWGRMGSHFMFLSQISHLHSEMTLLCLVHSSCKNK